MSRSRAWTVGVYFANSQLKKFWRFNGGGVWAPNSPSGYASEWNRCHCHLHPISEYFPLDETAFQMVRKNIAAVRGAVLGIAEERNFGFWHLLDHRSKHKSLGRTQKDLSMINHRDKLLSSLSVVTCSGDLKHWLHAAKWCSSTCCILTDPGKINFASSVLNISRTDTVCPRTWLNIIQNHCHP